MSFRCCLFRPYFAPLAAFLTIFTPLFASFYSIAFPLERRLPPRNSNFFFVPPPREIFTGCPHLPILFCPPIPPLGKAVFFFPQLLFFHPQRTFHFWIRAVSRSSHPNRFNLPLIKLLFLVPFIIFPFPLTYFWSPCLSLSKIVTLCVRSGITSLLHFFL